MVIDIDKPVIMTFQETEKELTTTRKKDIAQPEKTCTKINSSNIQNIPVKFKKDTKNLMIGNQKSIEVKFKVRLLNIQTCNLKTNLHHLPNLSISMTLVKMKI
jgi:hypothetical protein